MRCFLAVLAILGSVQTQAWSQSYPSKNVTLVVPFAPGGASDIMGRAVGQKLSEIWKQPVIIENKPGASTTLGTAYASTQPADGYTLLLAPPPFVIMPHVYSNLRYKALEDFRAVSVIAYYPLVTVVSNSLPVHNLKELFEYARKNPGTPFASVGPGSSPHLMSEYMALGEKLDMVHVPYRSGGQVFADLITGRISFYSGPSTEVLPQIRAGKVRAIAVLTEKRIKQLPDVPTSVEQGFGKYVGSSWSSIVVPAKTPDDIVAKIGADIATVVKDPDFRTKLEEQGAEFLEVTPAQAQAFLVKEDKLWGPLVTASGVKPEN
ncbi:Bug family tripartite tricarboxylate transporter substrate binding protein [Rhodoplanes sp. Z2-YC6860]|uniref:Bug family tripartite tricarboxylate transporter substrate binding protein n=1 Tax=Rhodoplanes sp. Z2-YC6860 TaxID=674703 RepID=UPI00078BD6E4|nr:tripartite tricarboxylate transporter substrate binding protein [Rhodoplanes sp. Z2-YC6860]AMN41222.1 extra-cytoplasmic solute receptor [Rhodoplanes sp. Z2-YC6860]